MTKIRAELSKKNPLYIDRHAFLSAYHFALQYPEWKAQYADMIGGAIRGLDYNDMPKGSSTGDPTARLASHPDLLSSLTCFLYSDLIGTVLIYREVFLSLCLSFFF